MHYRVLSGTSASTQGARSSPPPSCDKMSLDSQMSPRGKVTLDLEALRGLGVQASLWESELGPCP